MESESSLPTEIACDPTLGCKHYRRKCQFVTPCCNKEYICRFCHDEVEDHVLNRKDLKQVKCLKCDTIQPIRDKCVSCEAVFGQYFCSVCKLFDDVDKKQFHCDGCGICRIGGKDNFFHCPVCDMCLPKKLENNHKCIEKVSHSDCPVCLEDLHTSRTPSHVPACGHLIHRNCYEQLLKKGHSACPLCGTSMLDMKDIWAKIDRDVERTPMPTDYASFYVWILCRDCHKESNVLFHVIGLKCSHCGSYNTCRTDRPSNPSTVVDTESEDVLGTSEDTSGSSEDSSSTQFSSEGEQEEDRL